MNDVEQSVFLVGRVLAGFFYLILGMNHFGNYPAMTAMVGEMGIPAPGVAVIVTGILLVVAGVFFLIGYHPLLGVLAAALFFVPVTLVMHPFWMIEDAAERSRELSIFMRNIGLLGATLMFVGIRRPWKFSLDEILARRDNRGDADVEEVDIVVEEPREATYDSDREPPPREI